MGSSQVWVCSPTGIPNFASNPLQIIGTTGESNTSSLTRQTALSGYGPGPLAAVDPMRFWAAVHSRIETRVTGMSIDLPSFDGGPIGTAFSMMLGRQVAGRASIGAAEVITPYDARTSCLTCLANNGVPDHRWCGGPGTATSGPRSAGT
ncbi:hypothetical protein AB0M87_07810 [Streptomyces sp. NPDC051320]|uniref:hypothetical protein n=1 Tax=Streptomyces sp. NPDC051320 TaxID=3154644 RepID=UPI00342DA762